MVKIIRSTARRSNVTTHSYNPETKQLDVTFHQGRKYRYHDVTAQQYSRMEKHPSPGGFLHEHIIGKCDAQRLDD